MSGAPSILIVGTADTKADELLFIKRCIEQDGARGLIMDVGVLGVPAFLPEFSNRDVAVAAHTSIEAIAALGDENLAMTKMAEGAVALALRLYAEGRVDGLLALGGSMGTDLALDVTASLPLGMPKLIVSTVANSHLIPPERLAPDLMMMLWAGGLYGINSICRSILSQAAGAVLGACKTVVRPANARPRVAISSLGKSCLSYMVALAPALESRGYEPVVFHALGMGGRAMEALIDAGTFVAVFDLALCEVTQHVFSAPTTAGSTRLQAAGRRGIPQIAGPGGCDMIDMQTWRGIPPHYADRPYHAHNRLVASVQMTAAERRRAAAAIGEKLGAATGPCVFLLPLEGMEEWDRAGQALHDPEGIAAFNDALREAIVAPTALVELACHINDSLYADAALAIFDRWVEEGVVPRGVTGGRVVTGAPS
jgi:uncharacterized protein (UPF0261 family)